MSAEDRLYATRSQYPSEVVRMRACHKPIRGRPAIQYACGGSADAGNLSSIDVQQVGFGYGVAYR
jgi:hypothetical protein